MQNIFINVYEHIIKSKLIAIDFIYTIKLCT